MKLSKKNITITLIFSILLLILMPFVLGNTSVAHYKTRIIVDSVDFQIINFSNNNETDSANLYGTGEIYNKYYSDSGEWVENENDLNIVSMLLDVNPGDKIISNSFGGKDVNGSGGQTDGIMISFLLDDVWISSLSPTEVYQEYTTNGYITVPDGVNRINATWWSISEDNCFYIM